MNTLLRRSASGDLTCNAAIAHGDGHMHIGEITVRAPGPGEVRVRIEAASLCHTDLQSLHWPGPLVMGHEGAGRVESVGEGVTHLKAGDAVVLNWAIPCGRCPRCLACESHLCHRSHGVRADAADGAPPAESGSADLAQPGTFEGGRPLAKAFHLGCFARDVLVRAEAVTSLPEGPPARLACMLGCGVMTGVGSVVNVARVQTGESVAVLGCGGVGLSVVQGSRIAGAGRIVALDRNPDALDRALRLGATHAVRVGEGDAGWAAAVAEVKHLTGGAGADHAFESTGVHALAFSPLALVRHGGMALQLSGAHGDRSVSLFDFWWDKRYVVPLYGGCHPPRDLPRLARWAREGLLDLEALATRSYRLHELPQAMDDLRAGRIVKGIVMMDEGDNLPAFTTASP